MTRHRQCIAPWIGFTTEGFDETILASAADYTASVQLGPAQLEPGQHRAEQPGPVYPESVEPGLFQPGSVHLGQLLQASQLIAKRLQALDYIAGPVADVSEPEAVCSVHSIAQLLIYVLIGRNILLYIKPFFVPRVRRQFIRRRYYGL